MAKIISGKEVAEKLRAELTQKAARLKKEGVNPQLTVIIVGEDPGSQVYVRNKKKAAEALGMKSTVIELPASVSQTELLEVVKNLCEDEDVHGILVQSPLPGHIDEYRVINAIDPAKDVDAFHPINAGKIMIGEFDFVPCTPAGVVYLLKSANIEIAGKHAVIVGRSNIVGKPLALLMLKEDATVTVCHSKTKNLADITRNADILIAAVGKKHFITADMVKEGAAVIDVGTNRFEGKLYGDVDFEAVLPKASHITPVPGGVGPMTITMLLQNTLTSAERSLEKKKTESER